MPRYFFHIAADGRRDLDQDGTVLPDSAAARKEAVRFAGATMHDQPNMLLDNRECRVEVADEADALLCTIVMSSIDASAADTAGQS